MICCCLFSKDPVQHCFKFLMFLCVMHGGYVKPGKVFEFERLPSET